MASGVTIDEALRRVRARWSHDPLDPIDVAERVALRLRDAEDIEHRVSAVPAGTTVAARVFLRFPKGWASGYVHTLREVDDVIGRLIAKACGADR